MHYNILYLIDNLLSKIKYTDFGYEKVKDLYYVLAKY